MRIAFFVALAVLLAGCSTGDPEPILVVASDDIAEEDIQPREEIKAGQGGHIAGYVVDEGYRTLDGLKVSLPSYDLHDVTDRNGEFSFVDLPEGSYLLAINASGFQPLRAIIDVKDDEFTRLQVVLERVPPPAPYHETFPFNELAPLTGSWEVGQVIPGLSHPWICYCSFNFQVTKNVHTIVIEAFMEENPGGTNGFHYELQNNGDYTDLASNELPNPMREVIQLKGADFSEQLRLDLWPLSSPAPEMDKEMDVYVTAFYNGPPPEGWSISNEMG